MQSLGEDIVLLAVRPDGRLSNWDKLRFALSGSELVRLVAARKVELLDQRIAVVDPSPPDDPFLAAALADLRGAKRSPHAKEWVAKRGQSLVDAYLAHLTAAGVLRAERRKVLGLIASTRWYVVDAARQAAVRARLDEIARGSGPVDTAQAAFGGLVHAVQLDRVLYPGAGNKAVRDRLKQAARNAGATETDSVSASEAAVADAVIRASREAVQASIDAAVHASIQASIDAAVSASTSAAHHAGHSGGAVGGHH